MKNLIANCIRLVWHALYYALAPERGVEFAMTCKDVTEKIDLPDQIRTPREAFRLKLHLSLCQACSDYHKTTMILRKAVRLGWDKHAHTESDLENLNNKLLNSFKKANT